MPFLCLAYDSYSNSKMYQVNDIVTYQNKDYIAVNSGKGNPPNVSTWYWSIYSLLSQSDVDLKEIIYLLKAILGSVFFLAGLVTSLIFVMKIKF